MLVAGVIGGLVCSSFVYFLAKRMLEIQGLFDSSLDVDAAKRGVDDQLESRLDELDAEGQRRVDEREQRRQRQREQSADLNDATLAEIGRQFEEAQEKLRQATGEKIAETATAIAAAGEEYPYDHPLA